MLYEVISAALIGFFGAYTVSDVVYNYMMLRRSRMMEKIKARDTKERKVDSKIPLLKA